MHILHTGEHWSQDDMDGPVGLMDWVRHGSSDMSCRAGLKDVSLS